MPAWLDLALSVATALGTVAIAIVGWIQLGRLTRQFRLQGQRERKWKTLEACRSFDLDPVIHSCAEKLSAHWDQETQSYKRMRDVTFEAVSILNILDEIAIGIRQGIYDERVAYDHIRSYVEKAATKMIIPYKDIFLEENYRYLLWLQEK